MQARRILTLLTLLLLAAAPLRAEVPAGAQPGDFMESQYAVISETGQDRERVRPGEQFLLTLRLTPFEGPDFAFHMYGIQQTGNFDYMASVFAMDAAEGIEFTVDFPEGHNEPSAGGDMWVLHGQQVVSITGTVAADAKPGMREITAQFLFNTCTDSMCLPPSQLSYQWMMEVVPADNADTIPTIPAEQLTAPKEVDMASFNIPTETELAVDPEDEDASAIPDFGGTSSGDGGTSLGTFTPRGGESEGGLSLWKALLFAFLGGLILNFMPCVLPVVSIKVISLARHAQESPKTVMRQGLVFCLGIIATFLALALVVNILQAGGAQLGWGFQFQNPWFLLIMSTIIFAFGLSLAGVYTIKPPESLTDAGEKLSEGEGYSGSFFKGVLATILGTPCVGPFLGPALGYAFTQSPAAVWGIFAAVGVGMAVPYAVLVSNPKFLGMGQRERGKLTRSIMDAKGWLVDFERVMAFVLFATVLYLLSILGGSLGAQALVWAIAFLLGVAFALWAWGRLITLGKRGIVAGLIVGPALLLLSGWATLPHVHPPTIEASGHHLAWEPYSREALEQHVAEGKTVLVDFTADWCPNCKTNEAVALNVASTRELVDELGVVTLMADWTAQDKAIGTMLRSLGRSSIPLTAIFPASDPTSPILLDGLYTAGTVQEKLRDAVNGTGAIADAGGELTEARLD